MALHALHHVQLLRQSHGVLAYKSRRIPQDVDDKKRARNVYVISAVIPLSNALKWTNQRAGKEADVGSAQFHNRHDHHIPHLNSLFQP